MATQKHLNRASVYLRSRAGEEQAKSLFSDIWHSYYGRLWVFVCRMSIKPDEIDDMIQEVMLKVYENLGSYNGTYALSTWIYTIARNHCLDRLRHEKERSKLEYGEDLPEIESPYQKPEDALMQTESRNEIKALIESLSTTDQQIAFLRFYEECSYKQISTILNIPIGTLKYRVHAIRRVLKERRGGICVN